jgi:hypothetical protein
MLFNRSLNCYAMRWLLLGSLFCLCACNSDRLVELEKQNKKLNAELDQKRKGAIPDTEVYTLYRSSDFSSDVRVHVGTFDAHAFDDFSQNKQYNYEICSDAQLNFNERSKGGGIRFWCEQGRFREKVP